MVVTAQRKRAAPLSGKAPFAKKTASIWLSLLNRLGIKT